MATFPYSVWFQDNSIEPDDQDYEWVACILIEAVSADDALTWGNHLTESYCDRNPTQQFLRSSIDDAGAWDGMELSAVPVVEFGFEALDDEIGW